MSAQHLEGPNLQPAGCGDGDPRRAGQDVEVMTLTEQQLCALFAAHCECRPLDIDLAEHEHSHDCDTGVLDDIQTALNATDAEEQDCAMFKCIEQWKRDHDSDIYRPRLCSAIEHPPKTIQEWNRSHRP